MKYILLAILFIACNPVNQVLKSDKRTQKVVDSYLKNYPLKSDTSIKYLPGDTVEVGIPIFHYDTTYIPIKTLPDEIPITEKVITKTVYRDRYIRDTIERTVTDTKPLQAAQKRALEQDALLAAKDQQIKELKGDVAGWKWKFWGLLLLIAVLIAARIYFKK